MLLVEAEADSIHNINGFLSEFGQSRVHHIANKVVNVFEWLSDLVHNLLVPLFYQSRDLGFNYVYLLLNLVNLL